jgi:hypothetical protein
MYSKEVHDAILKAYESVEAYEKALGEKMEPFVVPAECQVVLEQGQNKADILHKLASVPLRDHVWVNGVIAVNVDSKESEINFPLLTCLMESVVELRANGGMPKKTALHLQGGKMAPGVIHPQYLKGFESKVDEDGRVLKKAKYTLTVDKLPYYAIGSMMVEISIFFGEEDGDVELRGMDFPLSNFKKLKKPVKLMDEFQLFYLSSYWKMMMVNATMVSTEQLIQQLKVAASFSLAYGVFGEEACRLSLSERTVKLCELGVIFELTDDSVIDLTKVRMGDKMHKFTSFETLNMRVNVYLWEKMQASMDPALHKKIGNACGLKGSLYFGMMNGAPSLAHADSAQNYVRMGKNAMVMAGGVLLRLYSGDAELADFVTLCLRFGVRVSEVAVHGGIKHQTYGVYPEEAWGNGVCCSRISALAREVQGGTCYNALGNGFNAFLDAKRGSEAARVFLGISADDKMTEYEASTAACFDKLFTSME